MEDIPSSQTGRLSIVKTVVLPQMMYTSTDSTQSLCKFLQPFFAEMEKPTLKFIQNCKGICTVKTILKKKKKLKDLCFSNFKTYYKARVIKSVVLVYRHTDQRNRIESPKEIESQQKSIQTSMANWFLTRVPRPFSGEKNSLFNKWCWDDWITTCERMKLDPYFPHIQKLTQNVSLT